MRASSSLFVLVAFSACSSEELDRLGPSLSIAPPPGSEIELLCELGCG